MTGVAMKNQQRNPAPLPAVPANKVSFGIEPRGKPLALSLGQNGRGIGSLEIVYERPLSTVSEDRRHEQENEQQASHPCHRLCQSND